MAVLEGDKVKVRIKNGYTRILVNDTEIMNAVSMDIHADAQDIPMVTIAFVTRDMDIESDGSVPINMQCEGKENENQ